MSGNPFSRSQQDAQSRARLDELERRARAQREADMVIDGERRLILRAPDGSLWRLQVDNTGALSTVAVPLAP